MYQVSGRHWEYNDILRRGWNDYWLSLLLRRYWRSIQHCNRIAIAKQAATSERSTPILETSQEPILFERSEYRQLLCIPPQPPKLSGFMQIDRYFFPLPSHLQSLSFLWWSACTHLHPHCDGWSGSAQCSPGRISGQEAQYSREQSKGNVYVPSTVGHKSPTRRWQW